ncbi:MAG: hypothetical protein U0169_11345 [Polyangiaceae bacterium]
MSAQDTPRTDDSANDVRVRAWIPPTATRIRRHPDDGFVLADPVPMGEGTVSALAAITRALCPPAPAPVLPDLEERIVRQVRVMLAYMEPPVALGFRVAVHVLDWSPVWRFRALARLRDMEPDVASRFVDSLGEKPGRVMRLLLLGVKGIVLSAYFDQDEVHRALGYDPVPYMESRVALRRRLISGASPEPGDRIGRRADVPVEPDAT